MNICGLTNEPMKSKFIIKIVSIGKETYRSEESDGRMHLFNTRRKQARKTSIPISNPDASVA